MKRQNIIIATLVALVALLSATLVYAAVDHRRSSDKYYQLIRNQGYDTFEGEEVDTVDLAEVDTVVLDTAEIDTIESIEYVLDDDTYERADMAKRLLDELGYPVVRVDSDYNCIIFNFMCEDEHMCLMVVDKIPGLIVEDNAWDSISTDNSPALIAMWTTINKLNKLFPFKILYYQDEDTIRVYTRRQVLMDKHTPDKSKLLEAVIRNMLPVKDIFYNAMIEKLEEMQAKED